MAIKFEDTPGSKSKPPEKSTAAARSPRAEVEAAPEEEPKAPAPGKRGLKARKKS